MHSPGPSPPSASPPTDDAPLEPRWTDPAAPQARLVAALARSHAAPSEPMQLERIADALELQALLAALDHLPPDAPGLAPMLRRCQALTAAILARELAPRAVTLAP